MNAIQLTSTLANNKDLQQDDLANIAHGITNRTLLGATDGTEHEGKQRRIYIQ